MYRLIIFLIIFMYSFGLKSQSYKSSSKRIELGYLITGTGQGVQAGASFLTKNENMHRGLIAFDFGDVGNATTTYKVIKADYVYLYSLNLKELLLWSARNNEMFLNAGGGGFVSFEMLKNELLDQTANKFSPGINITVEFEIFYRNLGFFIAGQQIYRPMSIIGDWEYRFGLGFKYVF